jgi:hypothetical protein
MTARGLEQQIVEPSDDALTSRGKGPDAEVLAILAQLDGVLEKGDERLNEGPHGLAGEFFTQFGQFAEQVDQATLLVAIEAVVDGVEIADERAGKRLAQNTHEHVAAAMAVDEEHGQTRIAETPGPGGLAVDAPAGLVAADHRRLPQQLQEFFDHRLEQGAAPTQMAEQAGAADTQAEEVVQQVPRFAQGNAEVGATVASQQACPRANVGAGQFQIATALAGVLTAAATIDVPAVAMPFDLGFGNVGDEMVIELAGRFEVLAAALRTLRGMNVVLDKNRVGRRLGTERAWMFAMFLAPPVGAGILSVLARAARALAALQELLDLLLQFRNPASQFSILRLDVGEPLSKLLSVVHDDHTLPKRPD